MSVPAVMIIGAGPTGLAAALFLVRRGIMVRIVDQAAAPAQTSRALAVNPRTLELLQQTGVSERILAEGRPVRQAEMRRNGKAVLRLDVDAVHPRYQMTILPQARTEALLTEALAALGVQPERGVALDMVRSMGDQVVVGLQHAAGATETFSTPILFAADGAHSRVREQLGIDFPGDSFAEPWKLADVEFTAPPDMSEGYIDFYPGGLVVALAFDETHWRYVSTVGDPLTALPPGAQVKRLLWASDFHIAHRLATSLAVGRICLGGDAAHVHSPLGARGMNLGIEDAYVFAACAADALTGRWDRLADYGRLRWLDDGGVVRRVKVLTNVIRGIGPWRIVRYLMPPVARHAPLLRRIMQRMVAGLDHPLRIE